MAANSRGCGSTSPRGYGFGHLPAHKRRVRHHLQLWCGLDGSMGTGPGHLVHVPCSLPLPNASAWSWITMAPVELRWRPHQKAWSANSWHRGSKVTVELSCGWLGVLEVARQRVVRALRPTCPAHRTAKRLLLGPSFNCGHASVTCPGDLALQFFPRGLVVCLFAQSERKKLICVKPSWR